MAAAQTRNQTAKDVKGAFLPITESDIGTLAGSGSFSRGEKYYRSGHITEAVLRGAALSALCEGSQEEPYVVRATLIPITGDAQDRAAASAGTKPKPGVTPIAAYQCECEAGGFCKHLVALLLTWINTAQSVEVRPEFADLLQNHSREQLLALCVKLLQRQPDMEYLVEITAPVVLTPGGQAANGSGEAGAASPEVSPLANALTADIAVFRRKAQKAFRHQSYDYDDYGVSGEIASDLQPLLDAGDEYANAGQWANAQAVYTAVAQEIIESYDETDDEGDLAGMVNDCCAGLARCLDAQSALPENACLNAAQRRQLIEAIYQLWEADRGQGGIDMAVDAQDALARSATGEERAEIETWLRKDMLPGSNFSTQYNNRARIDFIMALKAQSGITDEEKLEEYRSFGLYADMTELLLQMGRIDEAIRLALEQTPTPIQLTAFAGNLVALGGAHVAQGLEFIAERLDLADRSGRAQDSSHYVQWLGTEYARRGQPAQALAMEKRLFDSAPNGRYYRQVRTAANLPGNPEGTWTRLRPELIAALEARSAWNELVTLYVEEADARAALDALLMYDQQDTHWTGGQLHAGVAQLAAAEYPNEARVIYQLLAENLIEARGRGNYQVAAGYLAQAKELAARSAHTAQWNSYITGLRERNKRLTALQEELRASKVI